MWEVRPERDVWAMLGRQGLPEALPGRPGLRGKDTGGGGGGRRGRRKPTKLLFPAAALGARPVRPWSGRMEPRIPRGLTRSRATGESALSKAPIESGR